MTLLKRILKFVLPEYEIKVDTLDCIVDLVYANAYCALRNYEFVDLRIQFTSNTSFIWYKNKKSGWFQNASK